MISKEVWTKECQDLQHIRILGSLALSNISAEKRTKSDYQKVWQDILVSYNPNTSKHFRIWALQTKQIVISNKPYIDESEKGVKLLAR